MRQLLSAVNDPKRFAEVVASFGDCGGCTASVIAQFSCEMACLVTDINAQDADDLLRRCTCDHPVSPEVMCMRLVLACSSHNADALALTLGQVCECTNCVIDVVLALVFANVALLDDTEVAWRPMVERRVLAILDQMA
ncbi:hypothetical protein AWB92_24810 [Mycobacterium sp. IEC1808]|nr:hypothetical protein AWB92_24810 [Mycobacterium sp. IEC1808]